MFSQFDQHKLFKEQGALLHVYNAPRKKETAWEVFPLNTFSSKTLYPTSEHLFLHVFPQDPLH